MALGETKRVTHGGLRGVINTGTRSASNNGCPTQYNSTFKNDELRNSYIVSTCVTLVQKNIRIQKCNILDHILTQLNAFEVHFFFCDL